MSEEEKKEEAPEEKPAEESPKEEAPKEEAPKEEAPAPKDSSKKKKKIAALTEVELDKKIEEARKEMGHDGSRYLQHLISRKQALSNQ